MNFDPYRLSPNQMRLAYDLPVVAGAAGFVLGFSQLFQPDPVGPLLLLVVPYLVLANLVFGVYDLSGTPSQLRQGMTGFRDLYLPDHDVAARKAPDVSPLYADLAGLPPALFTVGTADYLYEMPVLLDTQLGDLAWNVGPGLGLGVYAPTNSVALTATGVVGLELAFGPIPLDLVVEYRPTLVFVPEVYFDPIDFTGHLRVFF